MIGKSSVYDDISKLEKKITEITNNKEAVQPIVRLGSHEYLHMIFDRKRNQFLSKMSLLKYLLKLQWNFVKAAATLGTFGYGQGNV